MRNELNDSTWITTYSGLPFWPLEPKAEDVRIEDIAHSLSNSCRWTGHVIEFYSVAQHSVLVSKLVPEHLKLTALLHDASEAYLVDLARPIKYAPGLGEIFRKIEYSLELVIAIKFGLIYPFDATTGKCKFPAEIKEADNILLLTEKRDLMAGEVSQNHDNETRTLKDIIYPWPAKYAEWEFLQHFKTYGGKQ